MNEPPTMEELEIKRLEEENRLLKIFHQFFMDVQDIAIESWALIRKLVLKVRDEI